MPDAFQNGVEVVNYILKELQHQQTPSPHWVCGSEHWFCELQLQKVYEAVHASLVQRLAHKAGCCN